MAMNIRVPKRKEFLDQLNDYYVSRKGTAIGSSQIRTEFNMKLLSPAGNDFTRSCYDR
jgi:hypothetical protein